ncbi:helix-turn-helix transcriptional regulator [Sutcliffiella sp. FSL R7-0096]|uniref:helix-turn-helix domain-containing protein n=1 Tax=Sutcliffiella sp. FSL R7-0096 TaxID=2921670 RepID=UPI003159BEE7
MTMLDRIKLLCKNRNISVTILEEDLGFPNNTIYQWKKRTPSLEKLQKVADYFGVSTDYLLGRKTEEIDPEVRSLAREIQNFGPENRALLDDIIKSMKQRGKKALDE